MRDLKNKENFFRSFVSETEDDLSSPTTSVFSNRVFRYRQAVQDFLENVAYDVEAISKLRKGLKSFTVNQELCMQCHENLAESLCSLAALSNSCLATSDGNPEISTGWLRFSMMFKDLALLNKVLVRSAKSCLIYPLAVIVKNDGRAKLSSKAVDKAFRDYQCKAAKLEKDAKSQTTSEGFKLSQLDVAEALLKERTILQYELCQLFLKASKMESKNSVGLVESMIELYYALHTRGIETLEELHEFVEELEKKLDETKRSQNEDQKLLHNLSKSLKRSVVVLDYETAKTDESRDSTESLSVTMLDSGPTEQPNSSTALLKCGYLLKRSKRKMHRMWYKRRCEIRDGFLHIWHENEAQAPIELNLLTCQIQPSADDERCFIVQSSERKYEFQAESENSANEWLNLLKKAKKQLEQEAMSSEATSGERVEKVAMEKIKSLPGNDRCCDCTSSRDVSWLCTNLGSLHCIDCAGVHRELGVHVSRIQSLNLDRLDRATALIPLALGNQKVNMVLEAGYSGLKMLENSVERKRFIQKKYVGRKFVVPVTDRPMEYLIETVALGSVSNLLHLYASGVDMNSIVDPDSNSTPLLMAVAADAGGSHLAFIQFLLQNGADVNAQNCFGDTAVHLCIRQNKPECLKLLLLVWNVNVELCNVDSLTPLLLAQQLQHETCERLLNKFEQNAKSTFADIEFPLSLLNEGADDSAELVDVPLAMRFSTPRASQLFPTRSVLVNSDQRKSVLDYSANGSRSSVFGESGCLSSTFSLPQKSFTLNRFDNSNISEPTPANLATFSSFQRKPQCTTVLPRPAPRKVPPLLFKKPTSEIRKKCRAIYNCKADNSDEISFSRGDLIFITREHLSDENDYWMVWSFLDAEGYVADRPDIVGRFPTSYVLRQCCLYPVFPFLNFWKVIKLILISCKFELFQFQWSKLFGQQCGGVDNLRIRVPITWQLAYFCSSMPVE
ncbi:Arf-GAP with SH3 domain, ANK repeat and PH domain-containing protein 1 [Trichinella murrelli]|uniref:Arf-GAP with SH3 domain, ANK repeat and PH domain-containing protein 1 n=1 Tax=Trichinella murrelli TaxID=144512 RepID=A0A0V0U8M7_9BILA|nr:Arf-GAP with SH3 domain, ANK repeat and PH domain-containing protein 1 [Trichinella murrelli]